MGNRIFTPELKKNYVLTEDATVLLYPGHAPYEPDNPAALHHQSFLANYKKGEFTHHHLVHFVEYSEGYNSEFGKACNAEMMLRFFAVTDQEFPDAVSALVRNADDLVKLGAGKVYGMFQNYHNRGNDDYQVFTPNPTVFARYEKPVPQPLFVREMPVIDAAAAEAVCHAALEPWRQAQPLNPVLEAMRGRRIPIRFTFAQGTPFRMERLPQKWDKKLQTQELVLGAKKYTLFTDQLGAFVLDESPEPAKAASPAKKKARS